MPARHYNLEYNVNGGPWLLGKSDETPGSDKRLAVTGLSTGTYAVKLRMVPLTGDTTPILSNEAILQVGTPGISEPVQTLVSNEVTVAELISRRDTLLAAAGVTVSATDAQIMNEALLSSAGVNTSVTDSLGETITAASSVTATLVDTQVMLGQVVVAISAAATQTDTFTPAPAGGMVEDFESGTLNGWSTSANAMAASNVNPITGVYSARYYAAGVIAEYEVYVKKTVTITQGQTVSAKYKYAVGSGIFTPTILINDSARTSETPKSNSGSGTMSFISNAPTGTYDLKIAAVVSAYFDGIDYVDTEIECWFDDITIQ